jgi:hypothetical protein
MKKLFAVIGLFALFAVVLPSMEKSNQANAQIVTTLTPEAANDSLTNTDTAVIYLKATHTSTGDTASNSVLDNISRSITISYKKVSGDPSSVRGYLQGTVDNVNWTTLDSLVVANQTENVKTVSLRATNGDLLFWKYRIQFLASGTQVGVPKGYLLRRSN